MTNNKSKRSNKSKTSNKSKRLNKSNNSNKSNKSNKYSNRGKNVRKNYLFGGEMKTRAMMINELIEMAEKHTDDEKLFAFDFKIYERVNAPTFKNFISTVLDSTKTPNKNINKGDRPLYPKDLLQIWFCSDKKSLQIDCYGIGQRIRFNDNTNKLYWTPMDTDDLLREYTFDVGEELYKKILLELYTYVYNSEQINVLFLKEILDKPIDQLNEKEKDIYRRFENRYIYKY